MKVLVSTTDTQGHRKNDFNFVPEGELLHFGGRCDGGHTDDNCGCSRSMSGLICHKATTTMKVVNHKDIHNIKELAKLLKTNHDRYDKVSALAEARVLAAAAEMFEEGDVLEYRHDEFHIRPHLVKQ